MKNFKALVFDMDGLLLDSERLAKEAFQATCCKYDLGDLSHVFMQCIGTNPKSGDAILENSLEGIIDHKTFGTTWDYFYTEMTHEKPIPLKKGSLPLLKFTESINVPMAIVTSTHTEKAKSKLKHAGILEYFSLVVGGDDVVNGKPDPEGYLKAAIRLGVEPISCLALEDSPNGVRSAVAAGMNVVQIPDLIQPDNDLLALGHIVLGSLDDVIEYDFPS